jgi:hypothetical protein
LEPAPSEIAAGEWEALLAGRLGRPVRVLYGRSRHCVVRVEHEPARSSSPSSLLVRLNRMFAAAPAEVREALVRWLRSGRRASRACRVLDAWIDERLRELHRAEPRSVALRTRGRHHDLDELARELLEEDFVADFAAPGAPPRITWGRAGRSRTRHSLRLGSYDYATRVVRVHRVLDQEAVPRWFVRFILFHELLHAALEDEPRSAGRRAHHGPSFRRRERLYADARRAQQWERRHIGALIASARSGRPLATPRRVPRPAPAIRQGVLFPGA